MEAHHYCKVVNDDLLQCLIFDGNSSNANLIGTEHIIGAPVRSVVKVHRGSSMSMPVQQR
jgi:hypothetical protein